MLAWIAPWLTVTIAVVALALPTGCTKAKPATAVPPESPINATASVARIPPSEPGKCAFRAWVYDTDKGGTNLRSGPGVEFPVVAKLPRYAKAGGGLTGIDAISFEVVEARNGWFRIAEVVPREADPPEATYPDGWIHGRFIEFQLHSDYAFASPDPSSKRVATSWDGSDGIHGLDYRLPDDCRGEWVHLLVSDHDPAKRPAWVRGVCGNTETSCDGVPGDSPPNLNQLPRY